MESARLSGYPFQRSRHPAAEDPGRGYEAAANDQGNNYSSDLQLPHVLRKIVFSRKQQRVAAVFVSLRKLLQAKEVISSIFAPHVTFKPLAAIPPPHDCADQPGPDFPNFGELRMRGMRPRILHEPGEVWVRDKYAERVEDDGCSVLSGALRVDQLAELIKLEVGGNDTADVPMQRCAQGDHRCANAE